MALQFTYTKIVNRKSIFKVIDNNIKRISEGIIKLLMEQKILVETSDRNFLVLTKPTFRADENFAIECWKKLA